MLSSPSQSFSPTLGGFHFLKNVVSAAQIESACRGQEELMAGRPDREPAFDWPAPRARRGRSWKTPHATRFRSELASLARSPQLLASIAAATQARTLRLWLDQLLWEDPTVNRGLLDYHWHTERSRWKTCHARLMVTAWLPLVPISPEMGPITMVKNTAARRWLELPDGWQPEASELVPATIQPGDAALFCWHTVHGNSANHGVSPRRAIALHYAVDEISYRPYGKFSHLNERLVARGDSRPNFQDPKVVPLVWES